MNYCELHSKRIVYSFMFVVCLYQTAAASDSKHALIDGILARRAALISGRIVYHVNCHLTGRADNGDKAYVDFLFSGTSWRTDYPIAKLERINHRGEYVEVHRPRPNGTGRTAAILDSAKSLTRDEPYPPFFAGSLWYNSTHDYIRNHVQSGMVVGSADVDDIPCTVIEWRIPAKDTYSAFSEIVSSLNNGGILRLYVSSELGYVLPRIEHLTPKGELAERFDSSEFQDAGSGIHFPMKMKSETFPARGQKGFVIDYSIESVKRINEPVPESAFVTTLPVGTDVQDLRAARSVSFIVGDFPQDIGKIAKIDSKQSLKRTWDQALYRGLLIGVLVMIIMFFIRRVYRR